MSADDEIERLRREISRLEQICVNAHDGILRGNSDDELTDMLEAAWTQRGVTSVKADDELLSDRIAAQGVRNLLDCKLTGPPLPGTLADRVLLAIEDARRTEVARSRAMPREQARKIRPGDMLRPDPRWNATEREAWHLPDPVMVVDVAHGIQSQSQTGTLVVVRSNGGHVLTLDAAWFIRSE